MKLLMKIFIYAILSLSLAMSSRCQSQVSENIELQGLFLLYELGRGRPPQPGVYKIFISSAKTRGDIWGGISGADFICNSEAPLDVDSTIYKAMLVDGVNRVACTTANCAVGRTSEHIDWVLQPKSTYVRADGTTEIFKTNANGIFAFGTATNSIGGGSSAWTGLDADWTTGPNCSGWTQGTTSTFAGAIGDESSTSALMISMVPPVPSDCSSDYPFYCVEQPN